MVSMLIGDVRRTGSADRLGSGHSEHHARQQPGADCTTGGRDGR